VDVEARLGGFLVERGTGGGEKERLNAGPPKTFGEAENLPLAAAHFPS
jgi:hypothetical protein